MTDTYDPRRFVEQLKDAHQESILFGTNYRIAHGNNLPPDDERFLSELEASLSHALNGYTAFRDELLRKAGVR